MGHDFVEMQVSSADLVQWLPSYDDRRAIVAQDGLASVEGFLRLAYVRKLPELQPLRQRDQKTLPIPLWQQLLQRRRRIWPRRRHIYFL